MFKYPKIHSLYKRDEKTHRLIPGQYSLPEFDNISRWRVQEKVDGTNIRIEAEFLSEKVQKDMTEFLGTTEKYPGFKISFQGRTDNAQMPKQLLDYLQSYFTLDLMSRILLNEQHNNIKIILFGEGYGAGINSGGNYRSDQAFVLFDVNIASWWLKQSDVKEIAAKLEIPYAPEIGILTKEDIVEYVKSVPLSLCSERPQVIEGVVCRSEPLMLQRDGTPIMFKLKVKDIEGL